MAQIKIKRGSGVPAGLTHGELAYDVTNKRLYIGITAASVLLANTDGGVASFNGLTGAVTGVTTGTANTFQALQSFAAGISASGGGTLTNGTYNFSNLKLNTVGGDEGGQIDFGPAITNTSLTGGVSIDVYQNRVRIFESGGTNRGVYVDLTGVSAGVGTNLIGGGGGAVSSVSGSGNGISVSPTTGAVVVQNTGVHSFNGSTGAVTGVSSVNGSTGAVTNIAVTNAAQTFTGLQRFPNGISFAGATFSGTLGGPGNIVTTGAIRTSGNIAASTSASSVTLLPGSVNFYESAIGGLTLTLTGQALSTNVTVTLPDVTTTLAGLAGTQTFTGTKTFNNIAGVTFTSSINLQNTEIIQNTTNGRVDIMPRPTGSTAYGIYFDTTSWGFGVIMGTVRSSDNAINTGGNFRFDVPITILQDTRFQLGSDGHYGFYRTDTGNNTAQLYALSNNANNSGAFALVGYFDVGAANRSPGTTHVNPNFYIYANGVTSANDFVRFEHDRTNANIVTGGTTGILMQPGSGQLGVSGGICGGSYILNSNGILTLTGATYTFLASDNGEVIVHNRGSGATFTVPTGLPVGFSCTIIHIGTGGLGFTSASGVTLNSWTNKYSSVGQHATIGLISYATNVFNLSGGLT